MLGTGPPDWGAGAGAGADGGGGHSRRRSSSRHTSRSADLGAGVSPPEPIPLIARIHDPVAPHVLQTARHQRYPHFSSDIAINPDRDLGGPMNDNQLLEVRIANPADVHPELRSSSRPLGPNNFSNTPADGVLRFTNAADVSSSASGPQRAQNRRFDALPLPSVVFRWSYALHEADQFSEMLEADGFDMSLSRSIGNAMGMKDKTEVLITRVPVEEHTISHVELYFRDQFIGRADMWRLSLQLEDTCVYVGQKIALSNLVRATVGRIFTKERTVSSGYVSASTKTIFRSDSAKFYLFIQMSKEMWDFDEDGELYNEKAIHGFLPELLRRWSAVPTNHLVSVILFGRVLFEEHELHMIEDWPVRRDERGRAYVDYYKAILDSDPAPNWVDVMGRLKEEVFRFQHDILIVRRPVSGPAPLHADPHYDLISDHTLTAGRLCASYEGNVLEAVNLALNPFDRNYVDRDLNRTGFSITIVSAGTGRFEVPKHLLRATTERMVESGVALDLVCLTKMPLHSVPLFQFWSSVPDVEALPAKGRSNSHHAGTTSRACAPGPNTMTGTSRSSFGQSYSNARHTFGMGPGMMPRANRLREATIDTTADDVKPPDPLYYDDPPSPCGSDHEEERAGSRREGMVQSTKVMFYSLPHWIDCSFFNVQRDKPFREDRFVPRSKMYDIQMMGVMENQVAGISIPFLDMVPVPNKGNPRSLSFSIPVHSKTTLSQIRRAQKNYQRYGSAFSGSPSTYLTVDLFPPDSRVEQALSASPGQGLTPLYAAAKAADTELTPAFARALFDRGVMADVEAQNGPDRRYVLRPRILPTKDREPGPYSQSPLAFNPAAAGHLSAPRTPTQPRRATKDRAPEPSPGSLTIPAVGSGALRSSPSSTRAHDVNRPRLYEGSSGSPEESKRNSMATTMAAPAVSPPKTAQSRTGPMARASTNTLSLIRRKSQGSLQSSSAGNKLLLSNFGSMGKAQALVTPAAATAPFPAISEGTAVSQPCVSATSRGSMPAESSSETVSSGLASDVKTPSSGSAIGSAWRTSTQWLLSSLGSRAGSSTPPSLSASRQIREILATSGIPVQSPLTPSEAGSVVSSQPTRSPVRPGVQSRLSSARSDYDLKKKATWWTRGYLSRRNTDETPILASDTGTETRNRTPISIPFHDPLTKLPVSGSATGEDEQGVDESDDEMPPEWPGFAGGVVSQLGLPKGAIKFLDTQTLVNPSKPKKPAVGNYTDLMRWQYLFPHRLSHHEVKWRSMTSPACLPLTASQLPEAQDLETHWHEHPYVTSILEGGTSLFLKQPRQPRQSSRARHLYPDRRDNHAAYIPPQAAVSVLKEMVYQRLSRGFQFIVPTTTSSTLSNFVGDQSGVFGPKAKFTLRHPSESFMPGLITAGNPIFLSLSNQIHRISYDKDSGVINVKRYLKHIPYSTAPIKYSCCIWARDLPGYQNLSTELQFPSSTEYNWTYLDGLISGFEDRLLEGLKYWRARFIVVPKLMDDSEVAELMASKRDLSLEEIRIAGMSRLASELQRFRIRRSGEPRQAFTFLMTSLDPTQSLYEKPFLRALELFHQTWPSYTGTGHTNAAMGDPARGQEVTRFSDTPRSALAAEMTVTHAPGGAKLVEDHKWRRVTHPRSFYGSELVSWMVERFEDVPDRAAAVAIGNQLMKQGFLEHARHVHDFKDGHYFYTLTKDWQQISADKTKNASGATSSDARTTPSSASTPSGSKETRRPPSKGRRRIHLSRSIAFDVGQYHNTRRAGSSDDAGSRDRAEICIIHHDISHNPMNGFNFQIHWMASTSLLIEELVQNWSRMLEKEGLMLVEAPIDQISDVSKHNPFQSPRQIRLAVPPPPVQTYAHKLPEHTVPDAYFEFCLLRHWGFILDQEASTRYPVDVEVDYQSRPTKFERSQFVHRSGLAFAQILGGSEGFLWLDNRLYNSSQLAASASFGPVALGLHSQHTRNTSSGGTSASARSRSASGSGALPRLTAEGIRGEFEAFCSDPVALHTFYRRILVRLYAGEVPVGTDVPPSVPVRVCHMASQMMPDYSPLLEGRH